MTLYSIDNMRGWQPWQAIIRAMCAIFRRQVCVGTQCRTFKCLTPDARHLRHSPTCMLNTRAVGGGWQARIDV